MNTPIFARSLLPALLGVSALLLACGGDASLGNDKGASGGASGGANDPTGGVTGAGVPNRGGSEQLATGGTNFGGSAGREGVTGGSSTGGTSADGGTEAGGATLLGGGGAFTGGASTGGRATGGNNATGGAGGSGGNNATGGAGGSGGNNASGGSGGSVDPSQAITDPTVTGTGACMSQTLADLIASVHAQHPELADIVRLEGPNSVGGSASISAFRFGTGFRLVFRRGSGDCPAGCIDNEYWYFESDPQCQPSEVGHYARVFNGSGNCFDVQGTPLWNLPAPNSNGLCPSVDISKLNSECVGGACPAGLTPVEFYGVAGTSGPLFCSCSIVCKTDPNVCPAGTTCRDISDGPGLVCYK